MAVKQSLPLPLDLPQYQKQLTTLRNLPEFAQLFQFLSFFRKLLHLNNEEIDIELLEEELVGVSPLAPTLLKIYLNMILLLSHVKKDINSETVDKFAWSVFNKHLSKPVFTIRNDDDTNTHDEENTHELVENPFGSSTDESELNRFEAMDFVEKVHVLYQLSRFISLSPSFRDKVDWTLSQDQDAAISTVRVDPVGWKGEFGVYYLLDDNRLYYVEDKAPDLSHVDSKTLSKPNRRKEISVAMEAAWKAKSKKGKPKSRNANDGHLSLSEVLASETPADELVWECVCVSLNDWDAFIKGLKKSRNSYDKEFCKYLTNQLMPVLKENEERRVSNARSRIRSREKQFLVVNRKRSSRLEEKQARQEHDDEEIKQKTQQFEEMMIEEQVLKAREKRLRVRDEKRREQREAKELKTDQDKKQEPANTEDPNQVQEVKKEEKEEDEEKRELKTRSSSRLAERHKANQIIKEQEDNEQPAQKESANKFLIARKKGWYFDCYCGEHGTNYDDGRPVLQCKNCEIWLHVEHLRDGETERLQAIREEQQESGNEIEDKQPRGGEVEIPTGFVCDRCLRIQHSREQKEKREARKREKEMEKAIRKKQRLEERKRIKDEELLAAKRRKIEMSSQGLVDQGLLSQRLGPSQQQPNHTHGLEPNVAVVSNYELGFASVPGLSERQGLSSGAVVATHNKIPDAIGLVDKSGPSVTLGRDQEAVYELSTSDPNGTRVGMSIPNQVAGQVVIPAAGNQIEARYYTGLV